MPLDRINAQVRRDAAAMHAASVKQRLDTVLQRARLREVKDANDAMRERIRRRRAAP
jgi:hypothetical protein